jgi:hypothetical protein
MKKVSNYVTFGCSHTLCSYLPKEEIWTYILKERGGPWFARYSNHGAGFSWLVVFARDYIRNGEIVPEETEYVVLQKPQPLRYPWWGVDETGYRYPDKLTQKEGMRVSWRKFKELSATDRTDLAKRIFDAECELLKEFREIFSASKCAYYHYWADDLIDAVIRPEFTDHNNRLGEVAQALGMEDWGTIIDPKTIDGVYDKDGDILMAGARIYQTGLIYQPADYHPSVQYNSILADKVGQWVND